MMTTRCAVALVAVVGAAPAFGDWLAPIERLGEKLYFDESLSDPDGQACASCHLPEVGFDDPDAHLPVSQGVDPEEFGTRNAPVADYAMFAPSLHFDDAEATWVGGQFWDGRASGAELGDPLADQALAPFLNAHEMGNPSKATVVADVEASSYAPLFERVFGPGAFDDVDRAFDNVALAIAAFERTALFAAFSSKYDLYLRWCLRLGGETGDCAQGNGSVAEVAAGKVFTGKEWEGLRLFMGDNDNDGSMAEGEGAGCAGCHVAEWTNASDYALKVQTPRWVRGGMIPPLFTDFTFDNLGIPMNTEYPLGTDQAVDLGLGDIVGDTAEDGKFKVMTLRNIARSAPYGHNGLFRSVKELVHFYNTRDVSGAGSRGEPWGDAEVPETVNADELGNLGLNDDQEVALVAFMETLTDGYMVGGMRDGDRPRRTGLAASEE